MNKQTKAYAYALTTIAFWSTIASASKITLRYINPAQLVFYSSIVSTLVLFLVLLIQKKLDKLKGLKAKDWAMSTGFGLLNPFAYYLVLFKAYDLLPAQQAQVINYTWAITLSLLSIPFLGQKVQGKQWLAIAFSYSGVLVIATKGNIFSMQFDNPYGVGLALLSTLLWALYWIFNTKDTRDPVAGLFLNFLCALPFIGLYLFFTQGTMLLPAYGMAGACYIGIFEMGLAFVLWLMALKLTHSAAKIANLIFIAPFGSLIFIYFLVGEQIFISTLVGLVLVIAGLLIQSSQRKTAHQD
ncbi:MAG: DMT family transporter [Desulfobacteraceae bacterium]|nr:DMT family transporter [Desulfobacteraceae bacterium]